MVKYGRDVFRKTYVKSRIPSIGICSNSSPVLDIGRTLPFVVREYSREIIASGTHASPLPTAGHHVKPDFAYLSKVSRAVSLDTSSVLLQHKHGRFCTSPRRSERHGWKRYYGFDAAPLMQPGSEFSKGVSIYQDAVRHHTCDNAARR